MKRFGKKQRDKQGEKNLLTQKILKVLNYTPVDYIHSEQFLKDGVDPLADSRKKLENTNPDKLCDTMLDPSIDADTQQEKVHGKRQRIHHIDTIIQLTDAAWEEAAKAEYLKKVLEKDREELMKERERLLKIRDELEA